MSKKSNSSTKQDAKPKSCLFKLPSLEGTLPGWQVINVMLGYSIGNIARYTKSSIRWLLIARDKSWKASKFSDEETLAMRELYHVRIIRKRNIRCIFWFPMRYLMLTVNSTTALSSICNRYYIARSQSFHLCLRQLLCI